MGVLSILGHLPKPGSLASGINSYWQERSMHISSSYDRRASLQVADPVVFRFKKRMDRRLF